MASLGKSVEGRDIIYAQVSSNRSANHNVMLVDATMHAREWITTPTTLYLLRQLVETPKSPLLDGLDFVIVPVLNPDGYEYSHTKVENM